MQIFDTTMFVLMNLVAAVCCVAVGPRGPGQNWRWYAAAGFGVAVLASLLWPLVNLFTRGNTSYDSFESILNVYYVVSIAMGVLSTALTVVGVLAGRKAQRQSSDYYSGYADQQAYPGFEGPEGASPYPAQQNYGAPSYAPQPSQGSQAGYQPYQGQQPYQSQQPDQQPNYGPPTWSSPQQQPSQSPPETGSAPGPTDWSQGSESSGGPASDGPSLEKPR